MATIEGYVTSAEQNGGGWVQLTFHHICNGCDAYSITPTDMQSLLDWLSTQVSAGFRVSWLTARTRAGTPMRSWASSLFLAAIASLSRLHCASITMVL